MTLSRKRVYAKTYSVRNLAGSAKKIIVEHPFIPGAVLSAPSKYDEKTDSVYRFGISVAAKGEASLEVTESVPVRETVSLSLLTPDSLAYYSTSGEIPAKVKTRSRRPRNSLRAEASAKRKLAGIENRRRQPWKIRTGSGRISRPRAATAPGEGLFRKLAETDTVIEKTRRRYRGRPKSRGATRARYDSYVAGLSL
jgi:hypothetical protein